MPTQILPEPGSPRAPFVSTIHPPPDKGVFVDPGSVRVFQRAAVGNAFTGAAELASGRIYLYPLHEETVASQKIQDAIESAEKIMAKRDDLADAAKGRAYHATDAIKGTDGYGNTRYPSETRHTIGRSPRVTGGPGARLARRHSDGSLLERHPIQPILHVDPTMNGLTAHRQMMMRLGIKEDQFRAYVGFTVWVRRPDLCHVVCTSRLLNGPLWNRAGAMPVEWAKQICNAIENIRVRAPAVRLRED